MDTNKYYYSESGMHTTIGVLALQGAFLEHLLLLKRAAIQLAETNDKYQHARDLHFTEVRNHEELQKCDALVIPGGESTTMSLVAERSNLLEPLRNFVKVERKPTWGTCAGLILLAEAANSTKRGGQDLIGGLDVRVNRNHFGRQIESFQTNLTLPFLSSLDQSQNVNFPGIFIRAPIVERILPNLEGVQVAERDKPDSVVAPSKMAKSDEARSRMSGEVEVMGILPGRLRRAADKGAEIAADEIAGDIVAVRQGNVFGTSFHPELTSDARIHMWWLQEVLKSSIPASNR